MSLEPRPVWYETRGSLQSCFIEGDAEQRTRERRVRRRALALSVLLQSAILAALLFIPLFGKTQRIALANLMPHPIYTRGGSDHHRGNSTAPPRHTDHFTPGILYLPVHVPQRPAQGDTARPQDADESPRGGDDGPPCVGCVDLGRSLVGPENRRVPQPPVDIKNPTPKRIWVTHLDPAILIRRIEPVYPPLMKQIGRPGSVELRAIVATDGTIQSLEVVGGDAFFYQSALDAVRQWHYKPTILDGNPVEVETHITVIYSMQR